MATLDELFDTAGDRLRTAAAAPAPDRAATAGHLDRFLSALAEPLGLGGGEATQSSVTDDLVFHVGRASDALQSARRLLPSPATGPAQSHLLDASAAVDAVRDVIHSHRGPDLTPLSAYAYALSTGPAHHYLTRRCAELAWGAAQVASSLARDTLAPSAGAAFADVHRSLSEASVFGRDGRRDADAAIGALSLTLPVYPVQAGSADRPQDVPAHLAEDCDRLSRAAFETLHHRSDRHMSGSDLQQLARWTAMQRLLAGRVLLRAAEELRTRRRPACGRARKRCASPRRPGRSRPRHGTGSWTPPTRGPTPNCLLPAMRSSAAGRWCACPRSSPTRPR
ncbi:hypothetical protein ACWCQM_37080 [Streptomyces sp. NPDC002125]